MVNTLLIIIVVLIILLVCLTLLFHRQRMRLNEESKHATDSEDVKSHHVADASQSFSGPYSSKIEVNLIELILSYRREILYDVKKSVHVNVNTELSPHTKVWLDTTMFRQLIMHLLRIAAQNTDAGYINIRYAMEQNGLRFSIENTSEPIPQEVLETLFTEKGDAESQRSAKENEIARTLSICKTIIDNMKGTIEASSKQDKTTHVNVITFWFPCTLNIE